MSGTSEEYFGGTHVTEEDRFSVARGEALRILNDIYFDIKYCNLVQGVDVGYLEELNSVLARFVRNPS